MNGVKETEAERVTRQARSVLNSNGFSLQYSVIEELKKSSQQWLFYGSEIPVTPRGKNTHIDCVFQDRSGSFFLIGECKRVQAGYADWVFVKTPLSSRKDTYCHLTLDELRESRNSHASVVKKRIGPCSYAVTEDVYGLGFRTKRSLPPGAVECQDSVNVINNCIEQVLRSTSGFINLLSHIFRPNNEVQYDYRYFFLPVIFTTAELWISEVNIAGADLETGNLAKVDEARKVPLVWFNYNRPRELSPNFRDFEYYINQPNAVQTQSPTDRVLTEVADYGTYGFEYEEFTRSILIINTLALTELENINRDYFRIQ